MNREEFDALVARLDALSRCNPRGYNLRVGALAVFGYLYILGVLLGALLLTLGIIVLVIAIPNGLTIKLGFVIGAITGGMAWAVMKALWVRLEPPVGLELKPADVPALFALLEQLTAKLQAPRFHHVLLVGDYNAAVVQVPRLGVFGWQRNYLLIGLPLMQGLAPDEFEAVLAHEFAHLSGNHARFGAWIYRVRRTWERVFEEMFKQRQAGAFVLNKFIQWFWPKFNAHAFVLARANEYEADRCAAEVAGAGTIGRALMRVKLHAAWLDESFWPTIFKRANAEPEPLQKVYDDLSASLRQEPPAADAARWLRTAFLLETSNADTHPCLKDRLKALDTLPEGVLRSEFPATVPAVTENAAVRYLGANADPLHRQLNQTWREDVKTAWAERHEQVARLEQEITAVEGSDPAATDVGRLWRKADALIHRDGDEAAASLLAQILALDPRHAMANFIMGRSLLAKDDGRGLEFIEQAVAVDELATESACELLHGYFARTGQRDQMRATEHRVDAFQARVELSNQERNDLNEKSVFLPHALKLDALAEVRTVFAAEPEVQAVALAQKELKIFPQSPLHVFAITVKAKWWKPRSSDADQKLVGRLVEKLRVEGQFLVFTNTANMTGLAKRIASVPQGVIYERGKEPPPLPVPASGA